MGTRALVHVVDEDNNLLLTIYSQYDGYPTGLGSDIKNIIGDQISKNGISGPGTFNRAGDLAARLVTGLKGDHNKQGGIYINPPGNYDVWEEFTYIIRPYTLDNFRDNNNDGRIVIAVFNDARNVLYCGDIRQFNPKEVEENEGKGNSGIRHEELPNLNNVIGVK